MTCLKICGKVRLFHNWWATARCYCSSQTPRVAEYVGKYLAKHSDNFSQVTSQIRQSYSVLQTSLSEQEELLAIKSDPDTDPEMVKMAAEDLNLLRETIESLTDQLGDLLLPHPQYDEEHAVIEVVPGAGGLEANMFAEEIFNMYLAYSDYLGYSTEVTEVVRSTVGKQTKFSSSTGITRGVAVVAGTRVFGQLKFETGVHRVQRVPVTGTKSDRLQTSTCSVAILPEPRDVTIRINMADLKFEFMRSGGAGGQSVNTTDSACRLTHIPTGIVVDCQEERSQQQNKNRAVLKLQNLLYQREFTAEQEKLVTSRKSQIGTMNRNEKIRTYNFNRHMITDHRLGEARTVTNISSFLTGNLGFSILNTFHDSLLAVERAGQLQELLSSDP